MHFLKIKHTEGLRNYVNGDGLDSARGHKPQRIKEGL